MQNWLDSVLHAVQREGKQLQKVAAARKPALQRATAAPARQATPKQAGPTWSNLLLQATSQFTKPNGDTHYNVEPAPEPKAKDDSKQVDPKIAEQLRHPGLNTGAFGDQGHDEVYSDQAAKDNEKARFAAERANRTQILGITNHDSSSALTVDALPETKAMSTDEYNALSDRQRAAVDFNTMLASAVKDDLTNQKDYSKLSTSQRGAYVEASKELFGKDRGSDLYAPETIAVLRQLKLNDTTADLDDYLGLKTAITEDDLNVLNKNAPAGRSEASILLNPTTETRADYINGVANKTAELQQALAKGNDMLQTFSATAATARAGDAQRLGGETAAEKPMLGFDTSANQSPTDQKFQQYFEVLANKKVDASADEILADAKANLSGEDFNKFFDYARARTDNAVNFQMPLGTAKGGTYRTPDEFRELLGLGE